MAPPRGAMTWTDLRLSVVSGSLLAPAGKLAGAETIKYKIATATSVIRSPPRCLFRKFPLLNLNISEALNIEKTISPPGKRRWCTSKEEWQGNKKLRLEKWQASTPCQADLTEPTGFQKMRLNGSGIHGKVKSWRVREQAD